MVEVVHRVGSFAGDEWSGGKKSKGKESREDGDSWGEGLTR